MAHLTLRQSNTIVTANVTNNVAPLTNQRRSNLAARRALYGRSLKGRNKASLYNEINKLKQSVDEIKDLLYILVDKK